MLPLDGGNVVDIGQAEQLGGLVETLFGEGGATVLLVDRVIAGGVFFAGLLAFDFLPAHELGDDAVDLEILVGGFLAGAGNDERGAGFVDQDGVHFVDDGVMMPFTGGGFASSMAELDAVFQPGLHVVAQVIEAELVEKYDSYSIRFWNADCIKALVAVLRLFVGLACGLCPLPEAAVCATNLRFLRGESNDLRL